MSPSQPALIECLSVLARNFWNFYTRPGPHIFFISTYKSFWSGPHCLERPELCLFLADFGILERRFPWELSKESGILDWELKLISDVWGISATSLGHAFSTFSSPSCLWQRCSCSCIRIPDQLTTLSSWWTVCVVSGFVCFRCRKVYKKKERIYIHIYYIPMWTSVYSCISISLCR